METKVIIKVRDGKIEGILADNYKAQLYILDLTPTTPGFPAGATYEGEPVNFYTYAPHIDSDEVDQIVSTLGSYLPEFEGGAPK